MFVGVRGYGRGERLALAAVAAIVGVLLVKSAIRGGLDFHVLYLSGQRFLRGEPIYLVSDGWMTFKYHPLWAVLFSVFAPLPERLAYVIFNAAMLACWAYAATIWARWLGYDLRRPVNFLVLMLLSFNALSSEMNVGQTNGILFLGATKLFDWLSGNPQKWFRAGLLATLLCSLKISFGLLAVFCVIRNLRTLLGMLAGALVLHVVTALFFGGWLDTSLYRTWIDLLLGQSAIQYTDPDIQGLLRFLLLSSPDDGQLWWLACVVFVIGAGVLLDRHQRQRPALIAGYWFAAVYLLSPLAWWNQILFTFPLVFVLLRQDIGSGGRACLYVCLAVYALASPTLLGRPGIEAFRTAHGFFLASVVIVAVMAASLWRSSRAAVGQQATAVDGLAQPARAGVRIRMP